MRVKLSYSVNLDEVPEIVAELIEDESSHLSYCDHLITEICDTLRQEDENFSFVLNKIDKVRTSLGELDTRLNEMDSVLRGFVIAKDPQPEEDTNYGKFQTPYEIPKESTK